MKPATIAIQFVRPGSEDKGTMIFTGDADFLAASVDILSWVISTLNARYGMDVENWTKTGNELMAAWKQVEQGKGYAGEVVTVTMEQPYVEGEQTVWERIANYLDKQALIGVSQADWLLLRRHVQKMIEEGNDGNPPGHRH